MAVGIVPPAGRALGSVAIVGLIVGFLLINVGAVLAKPGQGNSQNAKLCADWPSLYRSDGTQFANRDECVSYGATGGTILTSPPVTPLPYVVVVDAPSAAAGTYGASGSQFGPGASGLVGALTLVNDGTASTTDGCSPLVGFTAGALAIIDDGGCAHVDKVLNAQNAGAVGVIVVSATSGPPTTLQGTSASVTIPAVMVAQADGAIIKVGLPAVGSISPAP